MANQRKHYKRKRKKNNGLLAALVTMAVLLLVVLGAVKAFDYHEAQVKQAAINASLALKNKEAAKKQAFIEQLAPYAKKLYQTYQILPSITLAQAILESDWGQSQLASEYKNLFGVKSEDPSNSKVLATQEYVDGTWKTVKARFQVYPNFDASLLAHAKLLAQGTSWNAQQYQHVVQAKDYVTAAKALQQDGYATDPDYAQKIIQIIEKYQLTKYDP